MPLPPGARASGVELAELYLRGPMRSTQIASPAQTTHRPAQVATAGWFGNIRAKDVSQMSKGQFHEGFAEAPPAMPSERSTGLVFAGVSVILAILARNHAVIASMAASAALAFAATALWAPRLLGPLNRAWFRFALLLNRFVSPVVMLVLYAVVIVPAGLLMQLMRDPLGKNARGTQASYWIERSSGVSRTSMRDQF